MGQSAHPGRRQRRRLASALGIGGLVGTAALVSGCGQSLAEAATVLRAPVAVTVVHADGRSAAGVDGMHLGAGDVVRTGPAGRAELITRSRQVYVGSAAAVQVVNGAADRLRAGALVVDAEHGPGLDVQVGVLGVDVPAGSAVRAERSSLVRVGALSGPADVSNAEGRRASVAALHQVIVAGDSLPDATTPLQLTDDDGEARAVPDLVRDDVALGSLAAGINDTGASTVHVVDAALHTTLTAPAGTRRSERLLPALIAAAGPAAGRLLRYERARTLRAAGGSWGVVAHLLGVRAAAVQTALAAFEQSQPRGHVGSVAAVLALGTPNGGGNGSGGGGNNHNGNGGGGNGPGGSSPTPSPSPSDVVGTVTKTARTTVNKVLGLLPSPVPVPLPTVKLPVPKVPGLLPTALP
jgi:hypothetical protein